MVEVRANPMKKRELMVDTMVVARLPRREKRARMPTRISAMVLMSATR